MKIPEKIAWSIQNAVELFTHHPILVWHLLSRPDSRTVFLNIMTGANIGFHIENDGWREIGKYLKKKICQPFTK